MEKLNGKIKIYDPISGRSTVHTYNSEPSLADQSYKEEVDVNRILAKYIKSGDETLLQKRQGQYADISNIQDLQTSLSQVQEAQEAFETLPAELRRKLNHSPVEFINYLQNPANDAEAIELGLKVKKVQSQPLPTESTEPK